MKIIIKRKKDADTHRKACHRVHDIQAGDRVALYSYMHRWYNVQPRSGVLDQLVVRSFSTVVLRTLACARAEAAVAPVSYMSMAQL